jgi:hypothetical protein
MALKYRIIIGRRILALQMTQMNYSFVKDSGGRPF